MRLTKVAKSCRHCRRPVVMVETGPGLWRCMEEGYMRPDQESTVTALSITGEPVSGHFEDKPRQGLTLVWRPHHCGAEPVTGAEKGATK